MRPLNDAIARFFGMEAVSEELVAACIHRVRTRCSQVDLSIYRRKPAERRLQTEACEAICGAFRDHFPDRADKFEISSRWPGAKVMIKGSRTGWTAWIEPYLGIDHSDTEDGMDLIELDIDLRADRRSIMERVNDVLFHRDPRPTKAVQRDELVLSSKAPPPRETHTAPIQSLARADATPKRQHEHRQAAASTAAKPAGQARVEPKPSINSTPKPGVKSKPRP